ncbi:MAG TPA: RsmD family RNA methyltransferase [Candidatus Binatia bacterium]|nr:RsmD family RNA methyltransferase [Candidatus Binatia bacterium]
MRVIAGKFGSRRLASARGLALRPTSDRLRETLFDILQTRVEGSWFVDGFAGTGAVGIEALSRGARRVVFLENHRAAVALIRRNLESLGIAPAVPARHSPKVPSGAQAPPATPYSDVEIIAGDVCRGLATLAGTGQPADLLFFDPPYEEKDEYARVLEALAHSPLIGSHSLVIFERTRKLTLPGAPDSLIRVRTVMQGDAALEFYSLKRE